LELAFNDGKNPCTDNGEIIENVQCDRGNGASSWNPFEHRTGNEGGGVDEGIEAVIMVVLRKGWG